MTIIQPITSVSKTILTFRNLKTIHTTVIMLAYINIFVSNDEKVNYFTLSYFFRKCILNFIAILL